MIVKELRQSQSQDIVVQLLDIVDSCENRVFSDRFKKLLNAASKNHM